MTISQKIRAKDSPSNVEHGEYQDGGEMNLRYIHWGTGIQQRRDLCIDVTAQYALGMWHKAKGALVEMKL